MPRPASICRRISLVHGSAPWKPTRMGRSSGRRPRSRAASPRYIAYDGVQLSAVAPKSRMILSWRSVLPPEMGTTVQPEALGAEVQAEPAGEEPVAVGVLQQVAGLDAAGRQGAGDEVAPGVDVGARVADGGGVAGRAGGGVHAHDLVAGPREHAERVVVAQVDLGGERQVGEVAVAAHVAGLRRRASSSFLR